MIVSPVTTDYLVSSFIFKVMNEISDIIESRVKIESSQQSGEIVSPLWLFVHAIEHMLPTAPMPYATTTISECSLQKRLYFGIEDIMGLKEIFDPLFRTIADQ